MNKMYLLILTLFLSGCNSKTTESDQKDELQIGYFEIDSTFSGSLFKAAFQKGDTLEDGSPDYKKCYFFGEVCEQDPTKHTVAYCGTMNINGSKILLKSDERKTSGDHDMPYGKVMFRNEDGYMVNFIELERDSLIKFIITYKDKSKTIILKGEEIGD